MTGRVCNRYALRKEIANKTNYFAFISLRHKGYDKRNTPVQNVQNNGVQANTSL